MDRPARTTEAESANVAEPDDRSASDGRPVPDESASPQLVLARRMHALGFLADGVAHDRVRVLRGALARAADEGRRLAGQSRRGTAVAVAGDDWSEF